MAQHLWHDYARRCEKQRAITAFGGPAQEPFSLWRLSLSLLSIESEVITAPQCVNER